MTGRPTRSRTTRPCSAWFEPDLDQRLHYGAGLVCLTDRRLLAREPLAAARTAWDAWALRDLTAVHAGQHGGAGALEALGPARRLAAWRYTAARQAAAQQFARALHGGHRPTARRTAGPGRRPGHHLPDLRRRHPARAGRLRLLRRPAAAAAGPLAVAPDPLRPAAGGPDRPGLRPDARRHGGGSGAALPHDAAAGQGADPAPEQRRPAGLPTWRRATWPAWRGAALLAWLLGWARTYVMAWVSERIAADLRDQTYAHLQTLSLEFFGGKRTGDLMSRIGSDTDRICNFLSVNLLDFAQRPADDRHDRRHPAVASTPCWPWSRSSPSRSSPGWSSRCAPRLRHGFERGSRAWADMISVLADTIPGIRVVKAFAQERREIERFGQANERVVDANDRVNTLWAFFGPMVTLLTELGLLVVWAFGVWQAVHDTVTVGVLTAFVAYIGRFYTRLESMSRMVAAMQRAAAATHRVFEILDRVPSVAGADRSRSIRGGSRGEIEFRGVSFHYGPRRGPARHRPRDQPRRDDRPGRPQRRRQEHAGEPDLPLLRRGRGRDPGRRPRHPLLPGGGVPPQHRHRAAGAVPVLRHDRREHRLRPARAPPARRSSPPPAPPAPTSSSCGCPTATTRWWASAASRSPAASASASASPVPC